MEAKKENATNIRTAKQAKSAKRKSAKQARFKIIHKVNFDVKRIVALYKSGKSVSECAQAAGYPKGTGNNRTANALIKPECLRAAGQRSSHI